MAVPALPVPNGDAAVFDVARAAGVAPEAVVPWRDPLHDGPVPDGLVADAQLDRVEPAGRLFRVVMPHDRRDGLGGAHATRSAIVPAGASSGGMFRLSLKIPPVARG